MTEKHEATAGEIALQRARKGSHDALGELLEMYRPWLERLAGQAIDSWLRPRLAASDVAQESLIQAANAFTEFRGATEAEFRAWLRSLFANHLIDRQRELLAKKRNAGRESRVSEGDIADTATPSSVVVAREEAGRLIEAIAQLDEELRAVVQLRYLHELSFEEIGDELGLSRFVISRRWVRAINILAKSLTES
jgi:RNA polymerase sigma-70 factor (ECF subfamily)